MFTVRFHALSDFKLSPKKTIDQKYLWTLFASEIDMD